MAGIFCHVKHKRYREQFEKKIIFWFLPSFVLFVHFVAKIISGLSGLGI
jgi:hypothetical protein